MRKSIFESTKTNSYTELVIKLCASVVMTGTVLMVVGAVLSFILIGIPILALGILLFVIGVASTALILPAIVADLLKKNNGHVSKLAKMRAFLEINGDNIFVTTVPDGKRTLLFVKNGDKFIEAKSDKSHAHTHIETPHVIEVNRYDHDPLEGQDTELFLRNSKKGKL